MRPEARGIAPAAGGIVTLALLAGFLLGWWVSGGAVALMAFPLGPGEHGRGPGVLLSEAGRRVATGLRCPCGCPDLLLACDCHNVRGAFEVKQYIMGLLGNGRGESDARIELVNRYGIAIQRVGR